MQNVVKTKFENGDGPTKIYRDLARVISLQTIKLWIKKVRNTDSIELSSPPGRSRTARTKANILKAKQRLDQKRLSTRRLAAEMNISKSSIHRILRKDLALECGNEMLGEHWTYQQDGARPHIHYLSQKWCIDHFPSFISKDRWPPNSPDLCQFDYSLWNELAKLMHWKKITTKELLIQEIKHSVKKIEKEKILNFVNDITKRLRIIKETGGEYVR
ncbi:unnamed protein product [Rotaria magnacalcarata]